MMAKASAEKQPASEKAEVASEGKKAVRRRQIATRWGGHDIIMIDGFTAVPRTFLKYAAQQPHSLTPAQVSFVLNLMYFKWDAGDPFPSYATLAGRMGISVQYARDIARRLERKGMINREVQVGRTNRFDLQPLFDKLAKHVEAEQAAKVKVKK